jgi:hypothetical protein
MREILFGYKLDPTTWAYISALMMIGIYFKFRRFWSVRNLDLVGLICFSPGLLLVYHGLPMQHATDPLVAARGAELVQGGYVWLFAVSGFFLIRLLLDPMVVRRPLLEPNLSASGLTFTGAALFVFLMANVITSPKERLEYELAKQETQSTRSPGCEWFYKFAGLANETTVSAAPDAAQHETHREALVPAAPTRTPSNSRVGLAVNNREALILAATTRTTAILAYVIIVAGMVWLGYRHFDNMHTGVAAATLYLLNFYTSQLTSRIDHVVPAALLVWMLAAYRLPLFSGVLLGLAAGLIYYPLFLLPLWCSFYWRRGLVRFICGVLLALALLAASLALDWHDFPTFLTQVARMVGWRNPLGVEASGFWKYYDPSYRIPLLALFVAICGGMAIWPAQKNLGTLLSCSAAVMLATQFWHAHQGGLCMAWYLPLLILTIFRPNLEDRVAISTVRPGWWRRKRDVRVDAAG